MVQTTKVFAMKTEAAARMAPVVILGLLFWASASLGATTAQQAATSPLVHSPAAPEGPLEPSTYYTKSPALAPGAIRVQPKDQVSEADNLDDYGDQPVAMIADPIEPWNRFWFHFNDIFFLYVAKPAYEGWKYITPQFLRTGLSNMLGNTLFPMRFINNILQLRFMEAGVEFSRFMMNMMGSAGLVDLSANKKTIVPVDPGGEDFGQTLGYWGLGQGFYVVWPFIGPSSLRDSIGRVGDYFTDPATYMQPWYAAWGTVGGLRFNDVGSILPTYEDLKSISVDPYIAMREAYASFRKTQVER